LTVTPRVKVLLVNGNPAADPLENEGLYLRTALTPSHPTPLPRSGGEGKQAGERGPDVRVLKFQKIVSTPIA
jgi:hypothetical protein